MQNITIGTWNVEYAAGAERNALRLDRLQEVPADIWVLTETHDDLDLSDTHRAVSTLKRPTGRDGGRWTTIWNRWDVLEHIEVKDAVRTVAALIDAPGCRIAVYGTVLPWHSDPGPAEHPAKNWTEQDRVLQIQLDEWRALRAEYGDDVPLIVAGDLNMSLGGPRFYGTKRGKAALREGLAEIGLGCATEYDRLQPGALEHSPIDHILVPESWLPRTQVIDTWEGTNEAGRKLSDHSGLVVEVAARELLQNP